MAVRRVDGSVGSRLPVRSGIGGAYGIRQG